MMKQILLRSWLAAATASFLVLISTGVLQAQQNQVPLNFSYSYAVFAGNGTTSVVEFSYSFAENGLTYIDSLGQLIIECRLFDSAGILRESYLWNIPHRMPKGGFADRLVKGMKRVEMLPGSYTVALGVQDRGNPKRSDSTSFALHVRSFPNDRFGLSDIELITEMAPVDRKDSANLAVERNGYVLLRNVDALIAPPDFRLNSYVEIYNADRVPQTEFTLSYLIADSSGRGLYRRDTVLKRPERGKGTVIDVHSVVVNGLPTGLYILAARVFNGTRATASDSIEVLHSFYLYNPLQRPVYVSAEDVMADSGARGIIDPIYAGLKEEELDVEFRKASFIMNKHQQNIWHQLRGTEAKGRFLTRFWAVLDEDPATLENPYRDEYYSRITYASKVYPSMLHPNGWDSDRGRILLQYGKPDQIDRHPNDYNRKPYEIWHYTSVRQEFVFVDRAQTDSYQLVHSSAPGEVSFPNWEGEFATLHKQMYDNEFNNSSFGQ